MRYYSCDSHVVEAREVFEGLEDRFGSRAPRIERDFKGRRGDWLVLPDMFPIPVGRLGIAGHRLDDPATDELHRPGLRRAQPGRARSAPPPRRAGPRRDRRRGDVPVAQHVHVRHPRPRGGVGGVRAPQRLGARLLLGGAGAADRHRLPRAARRRHRPRRDAARRHPRRARVRHPGPRLTGAPVLPRGLRPLLGRRPGLRRAADDAHLHRLVARRRDARALGHAGRHDQGLHDGPDDGGQHDDRPHLRWRVRALPGPEVRDLGVRDRLGGAVPGRASTTPPTARRTSPSTTSR